MEKKCTQCGCTDLVETFWPHEYILNEVATGIIGESSVYEMDEVEYADVYICTQCGHYEFFNKELANQILKDRETSAEISKNIKTIDEIINELSNKNIECEEKISQCNIELQNLDITVRRSNELRESIKSLKDEIKKIKKEIIQKKKERNELEIKLENYEL